MIYREAARLENRLYLDFCKLLPSPSGRGAGGEG